VPTIARSRTVPATPDRVWSLVSDPWRWPSWWPNVTRVEEAALDAWTAVLTSANGRTMRADYSLEESEQPTLLRWRHEVEESPFERIMASSVTSLELEPAGEGSTLVRLSSRIQLRGFSRLGGVQVSRATKRQFEGALDGLQELAEGWGGR
jgi:uncharacterized protein YndB with AHSA1/START domain